MGCDRVERQNVEVFVLCRDGVGFALQAYSLPVYGAVLLTCDERGTLAVAGCQVAAEHEDRVLWYGRVLRLFVCHSCSLSFFHDSKMGRYFR